MRVAAAQGIDMSMLEIADLHHRYGRHEVLRGVDVALAAGELVGLIGPNGAGKSTLMRCIAGLERPSRGSVRIDGVELAADPLAARAALGLAPPPEHLPSLLTGAQCIALVGEVRGMPVTAPIRALNEALGLSPWLDRRVHEYSLGTRQKLAIVLALVGAPPLIVLDEVLNGLDPLAAYALKAALRQAADGGACVLLATHGLEVAERFLDRALLLLEGRIAADWDAGALAGFRADPDGGLEHAVVEMLRAARAGGGNAPRP
jgi:ABC-2 type transport system ATP-binding protein